MDKDIWDEWKHMHKCIEEDGALFKDGMLVMMAKEQLYKDILRQYHNGTMARHPSIWKTWQAIWQDYWWPTLRDFVTWYIL